ncbi:MULTISPECIES: HlyD family type I secretion periplasmic adaptor subunit [unclassified Saccharibacter]|uniref:HlyD family type I secretion periplasmic adaptor subunit n=1 Tax=unclassified Saccharibacter TaxID=2648722 RepID=UPI001326FF62|nr:MULTISPECIES: HlyD family type I secretion periplasmic adaptor subunit [unclassified Saccharibacter]MXV36763.1 HlyD family type I secretion periplasmic adaptor subunit [Saccharibacter sp. EH611]MXV58255.1 HlyD family type I secretion periplasmic adaptor subunit [Saccharibacter sp. EH70]MXV65711.1 HlyD family type I secretion periplasmic adaptor subunit [Saccharibacter sp. EH60]
MSENEHTPHDDDPRDTASSSHDGETENTRDKARADGQDSSADQGGHEEEAPKEGGHNVPRKATDPFAPDGMPVALLEFHSPTRGLVNMPATPSAQYIVWVTGSLLIMSLLAMALFPVNKVVSVKGRLISTQPTTLVQPFDSGVIRSLDAHVGDYVHKGQVLARLDPTLSQVDMENLVAQSQLLQAQVDRLKAEAAGQEYHPDLNVPASIQQGETYLRRHQDYMAHIQDFDHRIAGMESDLQGARANAAMFASKLRVVSAVLEMRRREQKEEVGSRLSTLGAQDAVMDAERALITAQQQANGTESRLNALKATRESFIQSFKAEAYTSLAESERRLDETRSEYRKARVKQRMILLRAPTDGVVLTVAPVSVGAVVDPQVRIMTLVPSATGLEMEAILRAQDAGFVKLKDHAIIKFSSFPYNMYGGAEATVRVISADTFLPTDISTSNIRAGINPEELATQGDAPVFYRIRLRVDKYTLHGQPSFFHPAPGVPVTADIDVGKRTIIKYLFSRIVPTLTNGMREPS